MTEQATASIHDFAGSLPLLLSLRLTQRLASRPAGPLAGELAPLPRRAGWPDGMADAQQGRLGERHDHDWLTILIPAVSAPYPAATVGQRPAA